MQVAYIKETRGRGSLIGYAVTYEKSPLGLLSRFPLAFFVGYCLLGVEDDKTCSSRGTTKSKRR